MSWLHLEGAVRGLCVRGWREKVLLCQLVVAQLYSMRIKARLASGKT